MSSAIAVPVLTNTFPERPDATPQLLRQRSGASKSWSIERLLHVHFVRERIGETLKQGRGITCGPLMNDKPFRANGAASRNGDPASVLVSGHPSVFENLQRLGRKPCDGPLCLCHANVLRKS